METNPQFAPRPVLPGESAVLLWIFRRDGQTVTCEVDLNDHRSADSCLMLQWDVSSLVEHFDVPAGALLRQAQIAQGLREHGWVLTNHMAATEAAAV